MKTDIECAAAKVRYQVRKEDEVRKLEDDLVDEIGKNCEKRKRMLNSDEKKDLENLEKLEAESRRVFDPIEKCFDCANKRCTDLSENRNVILPKPCDNFTESAIELLKGRMLETFENHKSKHCNEKGK